MTVWNVIKLSRPIQTFIAVINYGHKAWVDNGAETLPIMQCSISEW